MNPWVGWALAVLAVAAGYAGWGLRGVALAITVIVFWLLLQFGRLLRALRLAGRAPVGHVASAVMLHSRLRPGMRLMDIIALARSLGQRLDADGVPGSGSDGLADAGPVEHFGWEDGSGARVRATLVNGRLSTWSLERLRDIEFPVVAPPGAPLEARNCDVDVRP